MKLFFFDLKGLLEHLKKSESEDMYTALTYFAAYFLLQGIVSANYIFFNGESASEGFLPYNILFLLGYIIAGFIGFLIFRYILRSFYNANGGRKNFFERLMSIAFVISCRLSLIYMALAILISRVGIERLGLGVLLPLLAVLAVITFFHYMLAIKSFEDLSVHDLKSDMNSIQGK